VKWSAFLTGLRDVVTMALGSYTIVSQVQIARDHPASVNFFLIAAGVGLLGAPGVIGVFQVRRGNELTPATPEPSSIPPGAPQPEPSPQQR